MNQSRIWLVVNPTVGLPLFLGAVAVTSLVVHTAVLTNSAWFPAFIQGKLRGGKIVEATTEPKLPATATSSQAVQAAVGVQPAKATLVFPDGRRAEVMLDGGQTAGSVRVVYQDGRASQAVLTETPQPPATTTMASNGASPR